MEINIYPPLAIHELGQRDNQEDSIYPLMGDATSSDRLFIVCDGMGGHEHGEVASKTFSQALADYISSHANPNEVFPDNMLLSAIDYAYEKLDQKDDGSYKKMGTTLTLLYLHRGGVTAAHIGDSRIYHIRPIRISASKPKYATDGKRYSPSLLYVSRDHSLVFDLYQSGEISYDEMKTSPKKNVILRAVQPGEDNRVKPDIVHITDIEPGDWFYLCSDGMIEQMENDELAELLSSSGSDVKKRQQLIADTIDNKDNHSAYLIHVESVTRESSDMGLPNEEKTSRCNALNIHPAKNMAMEVHPDMVSEPKKVQPVANPTGRTNKSPKPQKKTKWLFPILLAVAAATIIVLFVFVIFGKKKDIPIETTKEHETQIQQNQDEAPVTTTILQEDNSNQPQPAISPKLTTPTPPKSSKGSSHGGQVKPPSSGITVGKPQSPQTDLPALPKKEKAESRQTPIKQGKEKIQQVPTDKKEQTELKSTIENL